MAGAIVPVESGGVIAGGFGPTEVIEGGTATVGVASGTVIEVPPYDPALHPPAHHDFVLLEGIVFGLSVGAVYVVGRTLCEIVPRSRGRSTRARAPCSVP